MKNLIFIFLLMLSACGMQGDLYFPEEGDNSSTQSSTQKTQSG
jgi:predicted small lipoprotein YifL